VKYDTKFREWVAANRIQVINFAIYKCFFRPSDVAATSGKTAKQLACIRYRPTNVLEFDSEIIIYTSTLKN